MTGEPGDQPIEVLLGDGGHVIVTFADGASRVEAADPIAALLVQTDGSESELAEAIRAEVADLGLASSLSTIHDATLVLVGRTARPSAAGRGSST